jgi:NAD(P)H-hydrate epimerase
VGHYVADGARLSGELHVLPVGFPPARPLDGDKFLLTRENLPYADATRSKFADKRIFGHTLVVGGSHGLTGAAVLAARAAARAGAGLVTVSTWEHQYPEMVSRLGPEIMTGYVPSDESKWGKILQGLDKYDSLVIGPGLGRSARARRLVLEILNNFPGPLVLDADALNALSLKHDGQVFALRHAPTVMTPHFGEFARFCGLPIEDVQRAPLALLRAAVERINCAILLKGPCTFLGLANGKTYFNFHPNDGMATGGVGDVLAGLLGGLLAQDTNLKQRQQPLLQRYEHAHQASLLAVYLHTLAGQLAAEKEGVRAMNAISLLDAVPAAFARLEGGGEA